MNKIPLYAISLIEKFSSEIKFEWFVLEFNNHFKDIE